MPNFRPIKPSRVSSEVCQQLKESILLGQFKAGDKLPSERDLAGDFKISRVSIREALRSLENSGFIGIRHGANGGAYVNELTFANITNAFLDLFLADKISILELYHIKLLIEPEIARLAALAITPEYAQRLNEAQRSEKLPATSLSDEIERKTAVHYILAEMCGNRFLEAVFRSAMKLTYRVMEIVSPNLHTFHPAGVHRALVKAVLAGDPAAASSAMKKHVIEFGEILMKMEKTYRKKKSL